MKVRHLIATTAAVFALGVAMPAYAQTVDEDGNGSADGNLLDNDYNDILSENDLNGANNGSVNASQGGEVDLNSASNGSMAAAQGGEIDSNSAVNGSNAAAQGGEINTGNYLVADQELTAININKYLDEVVDLDGEDETDTAVGYNSGQNQIRGNAFAAFAGILNQAWNTGINANTQAATNIAAQGTVNFGSGGTTGDGDGDAD